MNRTSNGSPMPLGLPVVAPHHALGDAITTAQLFLALTARLGRLGYRNARDFVDLSLLHRTPVTSQNW